MRRYNEPARGALYLDERSDASSKSERCPSAKTLQRRGHMAAGSRSFPLDSHRVQGFASEKSFPFFTFFRLSFSVSPRLYVSPSPALPAPRAST